MNRRNFIGGMLTAMAGFLILPPAETYGRIWRVTKPEVIYRSDDLTGNNELILSPPFPVIVGVVTSSGFELPCFNGEWVHVGGGRCLKFSPLEEVALG